MVNVNLLEAETIKRGHSNRDVAVNALHISPQAYGKKRRKISKFTTDDADKICDYLDISDLVLRAQIFLA
ncbi:MAG: hypothetical protein K6F88_03435 [Ruminococcus sp.]|nr:hypothetical protein [Ruminococcus sp.]